MPEREIVIANLRKNIRWIEDYPQHQFPGHGNVTVTMRDALELLNERIVAMPTVNLGTHDPDDFFHCDVCGGRVGHKADHCRNCGRKLWWGDAWRAARYEEGDVG